MDYIGHDQQQTGVTSAPHPRSSPPQAPNSWASGPALYTSQAKLGLGWGSYDNGQAPPTRYLPEKDALAHTTVRGQTPMFRSSTLDQEGIRTLQSTYLMRKTARFGPSWFVACLALLMASVTTYYSTRVMVDQRELPPALVLSPGRTVLVVNVLSKVVAFLCLSLFTDIVEALRWTLACRPNGILLTSFLAMSRATPITGVLYLCKVRGMHQIWALQRFAAFAITFVVSIVLITDVTFKVVYTPYTPNEGDSDPTLRVVAGLAPVTTYGLGNISATLVPLLALTHTLSFITDSRFVTKVAPVNCTGADTDCSSILMPGGMESVRFFNETGRDSTEQPSLISGDFPGGYDSIVVHDAPAYQLEYQSIVKYDSSFRFNRSRNATDNGDCVMHLESQDDGILFCARQVGNALFLGWSVCPDAQFLSKTCQSDQSWANEIGWNTTVAMYSRRATVAYDRQNISIVGVESLSPPMPIEVPGLAFKVYMAWIMSEISQTLNRTSDPSAFGLDAARYSFGYGAGYLLRLYQSTYATYVDGGVYLLRSLIAVPFQFATAIRQFGNPKQMPPENIGTASLSVSAYRALIQPWTVWTFGLMSIILTLWCMVLLLWMNLFGPYSPNISFFPEIDITSKSSAHPQRTMSQDGMEVAEKTLEDLARLTRSFGLGNAASRTVLEAIKGKRIYCGSLPGASDSEDHIVLVTKEGELKVLNKFQQYL